MKKLFLLALIGVLVSSSYAQSCLGDVWQSLQNHKIMEAKKKIDECMVGNEQSAKAWLYKGNVYLSVFNQDEERLKKNPEYVSKNPDAIWVAYESFYKALVINKDIAGEDGLISAKEGQLLCGKPFYERGIAAKDAKDYPNAEKLLRAAIRCFNLDDGYKKYLGYLYYDLANVTLELKGEEAYKEILEEAYKANTDRVQIYHLLYQIYSNEKDSVKCGALIKKAKKNVAEKDQTSIFVLELSYWANIGDTTNLYKTVAEIGTKFDSIPAIITDAATYLIDAKQFEKATELTQKGLEKNPNDFSLNSIMAYCYYKETNEFIKLGNAAVMAQDFELANHYKTLKDSCLMKAHDWAEKAYQIQPRDFSNASMLKQLKLQLMKEVPAELNAIIEETKPKQ